MKKKTERRIFAKVNSRIFPEVEAMRKTVLLIFFRKKTEISTFRKFLESNSENDDFHCSVQKRWKDCVKRKRKFRFWETCFVRKECLLNLKAPIVLTVVVNLAEQFVWAPLFLYIFIF